MKFNQFIMKYLQNEDARRIIFTLRKKLVNKIVSFEELLKYRNKVCYYVCQQTNHYSYKYHQNIKEWVIDFILEAELLEHTEEGVYFKEEIEDKYFKD